MNNNEDPIKSFGPAKGLNPDKFFDRVRPRDVFGLLSAVAILIIAMGISSVSYRLQKESTDALDNHSRIEENSELEYYLVVKSDGVDRNGVNSDDSTMANIGSGITAVTDRLPVDLQFVGFKTTDDGTIGAVARNNTAISCAGHVIDDTKESSTESGTWNEDHSEFFYHGLHYDAESRLVTFKAENIQAGCELTVGIVTKTPSLGTAIRKDFYNTANLKDGGLNLNSNTFHTWIGVGKEEPQTYDVKYSYTGAVPNNAPTAPATQSFVEDSKVSVELSPDIEGYQFSGWTTGDVVVSSGEFLMPPSQVNFIGSFVAKTVGTTYSVSYIIDGDAPIGYKTPKVRQYEAGSIVALDSMGKGSFLDDFTFNGWTSEDVDISERGFTMPAGDVTIHGSFTQKTYTVSYQFEGDILPDNANELLPIAKAYPAGAKVKREADPTADGYRFVGWYKDETFTMPDDDIVIYGEWAIQNGFFSPEISMEIVDEQIKYKPGDTVEFVIEVKNTANYDITNVQLIEQMEGAEFIDKGSAYEVQTEQYALLSSVPRKGSATIYAKYTVEEDDYGTYSNTVKLGGALAGNGFILDDSQDYLATAGFEVGELPEDEATTADENDVQQPDAPTIANTFDGILRYCIVVAACFIGLAISIKVIKKTNITKGLQKNQRLNHYRKFVGLINPSVVSNKRMIMMGIADIALIGIIVGLAVNNMVVEKGDDPSHATISFMSSGSDYNANEGGAWRLTKSAKWIGDGKVELSINVDTVSKSSEKKKDIMFVVDVSGSMEGDKLSQVKSDMAEVVKDVLSDEENQISLVSFESEASINLGFTNDEILALEAIESLETGNNTNYYDALRKVEEALAPYEEDDDRELYVLILTDGLPTIGSPNEIYEYSILKSKYPYSTIGAIQYEMGSSTIYAPITRISDEQYIADMETLHNTLFDVVAFPYTYDTFEVIDSVEDNNFILDTESDIEASIGEVDILFDENHPSLNWRMNGELRSGSSAKLVVRLRLKDEFMRVGGEYSTNRGESVTSSIMGQADETVSSTETPILRNNYFVTFDDNAPGSCTVDFMPEKEEHFVYQLVEFPEDAPTCNGYNFSEFVIMTDSVKKYNDDFYIMPEEDVEIKATWNKTSIEKTADGEVYMAKTLYNAIAKKTKGVDDGLDYSLQSTSSNGDGVNTLSSTVDNEYPVYYYRGNVNDNNVVFANFCWKAVRTTDTGGVKLIYNGVPTARGTCQNSTTNYIGSGAYNLSSGSLAYVGYMYGTVYDWSVFSQSSIPDVLSTYSASTAYWFADSVEWDEDAQTWILSNPYKIEDASDYASIQGKYTFHSAEDATTGKTVYYVAGVKNTTMYLIGLYNGNPLDYYNTEYTYGDSYVDNGDGTYTILNATTIKREQWYLEYKNVINKYACKNAVDDTCDTVLYVLSWTGPTRISYITSDYPKKFASDFDYIDGKYYLKGDSFISWDATALNKSNGIDDAHYTCMNVSGECTNLRYIARILDSFDAMPSGITLYDGKGVDDAISEMMENKNNSYIKSRIDRWYENNLKGTEYETMIEDTPYCNDRSFADLTSGWNKNGGNVRKDLKFGPALRQENNEPSLVCPNPNDAFTVSAEIGNGALKYPIGLLTNDELILAGQGGSLRYGSNSYLYLEDNKYKAYWTMSPKQTTNDDVTGFWWSYYGDNTTVRGSYYIRPVVSIAPDTLVTGGDGKLASPWTIKADD